MLNNNRLAVNGLRNVVRSFSDKILPFEALPGPRRIPFLGMLNDIVNLGNASKLHETIEKHHKKYGNIFRIQIGETNAIFVKSPDLMRNIFQYEGKYPKHPLPESWIYLNKKKNYKRGLFFMEDEEWLRYRKILNQQLLRDYIWSKEPIVRICDKAIKELKHLMGTNEYKVKAIEGKMDQHGHYAVTKLEKFLYKWSIEVILSLMLGKVYDEKNAIKLKEIVEKFSQTVYKIFLYSSQLMNIPPHLADKLHITAWIEFEKAVPETLDLALKIINMSIDELEEGDGLLKRMQDQNIDRNDVTRIFADFIIAAGDTTSFATQWSLYLLAKNLEVQDVIRNSIENSNGNLESPLIRGTVRETLRLYPVAPFIGRFLASDAVIGSYHVPKNTLALLSLFSSGRDPNNFTDPLQFLPQRWIRSGELNDNVIKPHASMPYAIGSRSCIGRKIANMQMHFLLTKILQNFSIKVLNKKDVEPKLKMVVVPREEIKLAFKPLAPLK